MKNEESLADPAWVRSSGVTVAHFNERALTPRELSHADKKVISSLNHGERGVARHGRTENSPLSKVALESARHCEGARARSNGRGREKKPTQTTEYRI